VELTVHPGEGEDMDRARYHWGYRWEDELAALVGPVAKRAVADAGFALATYADLPAPP
jgi:chitin disaccharide deacetylase